ncbi:MAG: ABC transporter ATP-binding protein [Lysobacter sp.]|nr:ABC transporter ATP-binding protein [Lysobacter sp.]MDQ3269116.1 ABC transporter ATP-binding protein/permease [Pseudomonadota bacterium]
MDEGPAPAPGVLKRFKLLRPYSRRLSAAYTLLLITTVFQLFYPKAIAIFIDKSTQGATTSWLLWAGLGTAALLVMHTAALAMRHYLFASTGSKVVADLRVAFFGAVMGRDIGFFDSQNVGDLTNRLSTDIEHLQEALTVHTAMLVQTTITGIGAAAMLLVISPQLSLLVLVLGPLVVFATRWVGTRIRVLGRMKQERLAYCGRLAQEVFSSIRLVHAFTQEPRELEKFKEAVRSYRSYALSADRLFACLEGGGSFVRSMALLATVMIGGTMVASQSLSVGELTGFILYAGMAAGSATTMSGLWGVWMRLMGATDQVFELLDSTPAPENASGASARLDGEIRFDSVRFAYPMRPGQQALVDFSLSIRPGEKIALVGGSGAGKSTVVNLLLGFYTPGSGKILVDGVSIVELDRSSLRKQIAIVEQEPALFSCSILDNIRYGAVADDVSDEAVLQAARNAHVDEFVSAFPDGYGTLVGARGMQLSGGQKQRVAIARALLRDPRVLVLDEATSALDSQSEGKVQATLRAMMVGRTTIIIAHRLSTIAFADRVVVMREGRIVQCGSHTELMKEADGYYRQLVSGQMLDASGAPLVWGDAARADPAAPVTA